MKLKYQFKDITNIEDREPGEYYLSDIVYVKKPEWNYVKIGVLSMWNPRTECWVALYTNAKKGDIRYEEIPESYINKLIGTEVKKLSLKDVYKGMRDVLKELERNA